MNRPLSRRALLWSLGLPLLAPGCAALDRREVVRLDRDASRPLTRIALGSCLREDRPQPVWRAILAARPELFIHLGDNIYADTEVPEVMRRKYRRLWDEPGYQALRRAIPVHAIWDDHDYGRNNADAGYAMKDRSRAMFCDFFGEPDDSPRRHQPGGIYASYAYGPRGQRVQIILLDGRWDRSPEIRVRPEARAARKAQHMGYLEPDESAGARMLGEAQWRWLAEELRAPAELRVIASGTRVLAEGTGHEQWANVPRERRRLFDMIRQTGAGGVLFVSGDPHFAEFSRLDGAAVPYPLWEMTSSSLNQYNRGKRRNERRVLGPWGEPNFGLIDIDWAAADPVVQLEIRDVAGRLVLVQAITLNALQVTSA